jgi:hypothetical protein
MWAHHLKSDDAEEAADQPPTELLLLDLQKFAHFDQWAARLFACPPPRPNTLLHPSSQCFPEEETGRNRLDWSQGGLPEY